MMIRKYIVKDMPEAVVLIRKELGKDAVILNTKRITVKKWLGLWRYKRLEVLAATGDDVPVRVHLPQPETQHAGRGGASTNQWPGSVPENRPTGDPATVGQPPVTGSTSAPSAASDVVLSADASAQLADVRKQLEEVKRLLAQGMGLAAAPRQPIVEQLLRHGVSQERVAAVIESFAAARDSSASVDTPNVGDRERFVAHVIEQLGPLAQAAPISPNSRIVALVGPTGVGKTTTVAKLAALHVLAGKRKVGLLTTDTFRIAAVDQLRTYANILNVPLEVVYELSDMPAALAKLADRDLIFVDTAGRNFRTGTHLEDLRALLGQMPVDEVCLVLSLTSKAEDLTALAATFAPLPVHKLIFTKLDETTTYGSVLELLWQHGKPLSYFTTGQNVPDDIEVASVERILRLIFGGAA